MNETLIFFALEAEAAPLRRAKHAGSETSIVVTGMGMERARQAFEKSFPISRPRQVLTCGLAGALTSALRLNDVVFDADADLPLASRLTASQAIPARFHCSRVIVATAQDKERLHHATGADAVDMESEVIRDLCRIRGVPSATVRVISDLAGETLPLDFNHYLNADMSMNFTKIGMAVLRHPRALPSLLQFQKQTNAAAVKLGAFLADLLRD